MLSASSAFVAGQLTPGLLVDFHARREIPQMRTPYGHIPADANNHIRAVRTAKGMTLEDVADAMNTTPQTVQRWELEGNLTVKKLVAVAAFLGVAPAELLPGIPRLTAQEEALLALFRRTDARDRDTLGTLARTLAERGGQETFEVRKTGSK